MAHTSNSLPPIEGLTAVMEAARTGSFSSAAEALGLTHGAVSRRVHAVEHWLGTPLFERHGRGVRPTPAGQRFLVDVANALATIRESADRWRARPELPVVRISVVPSFGRLWLVPHLPLLQGVPPRVRIEPLFDHRLAGLGEGGADLAIRYGRGRWPGVESRPLFDERLFPVAAPSLAMRLGPHATPGRIAEAPLLHDSNTSQWRAWMASAGVQIRAKAADRRFEDYDIVLAAAEAGLGVALLRSPLGDERLRTGVLVPVSRISMPNALGHHLVAPRGTLRPAVEAVLDSLLSATAVLRA